MQKNVYLITKTATKTATMKVSAIIREDQPDKHGFCKIYIRINDGNKRKYVPTEHKVLPSQFKKDKGKIVNHKDALQINNEIKRQIDNLEGVNGIIPDRNIVSFTDFVNEYCRSQTARKKKKENTILTYQRSLAKLQKFSGKLDISFNEITPAFLEKYEEWLIQVGNKPGTIYNAITKFFRKFFKIANKKIQGFNIDPFKQYDAPTKPEKNDRNIRYLTLLEVDKIEQVLDLETLTEKEYIDACYFLLECYAGIRHSDWKSFTIERLIDTDNLKLRAKKNGEAIYLSLSNRPRLNQIIQRIKELPYNSDYFSTRDRLKKIAKKAGLDKSISTHMGRHTCGTLHADLGFSKEYVAEILGVTMDTVEVYYTITRQKLKKEDERIRGL
jgi:site-specific recombinase XerD